MIYRALFLADGSSDEPLGEHLEVLCARRGLEVRVATPDLGRLPDPPGRRVSDRLKAIVRLGDTPDILFVHRDAEGHEPAQRVDEISTAVKEVGMAEPWVPVVPVRMTEAWLLLDESSIRFVAAAPGSTADLGLPPTLRLEHHSDPKALLKSALDAASGLSGRRLNRFQQRFGQHRRTLLQRLDIDGPVRELPAWRALESELDALSEKLATAESP